jgi:fluoride exporter
MSFVTCLYVVLGGAIGTFARYAISVAALPISRQLPWGTIIINITGCALIGFFGTLTLAHGRYPTSENVRLFVMTGICGGYTTFSAFSLQTFDLMRGGASGRAILNVVLSVVLCVCAVALGHWAASRLNDGATAIAQISIEEEA